VSTIDFEGAIPGMIYLFSTPKNRRLLMPEVAILSEEEATGTSVDQQNKPHHTEYIDVENTSILAKEMGMSKKQLMATQEAAVVTNRKYYNIIRHINLFVIYLWMSLALSSRNFVNMSCHKKGIPLPSPLPKIVPPQSKVLLFP